MPDSAHFKAYEDDEDVYNETLSRAAHPDGSNFVVEFGTYAAQVAVNVNDSELEALLGQRVQPDKSVRWINFWKPADHQKSIALLRRKYNFSPRLVEMITTRPPPISKAPISDDTSLSKKRDSSSSLVRSKADLEMGQLSPTSSTGSTLQREHNFYDIARNFTSYHSIDVGDQFIAVGANWMQPLSRKPEAKLERVWCWFVLCTDATVISFHEDLSVLDRDEQRTMAMRHHILSVLGQLSEHGRKSAVGIDVLGLRSPKQDAQSPLPTIPRSEIASNLFYYLFDNWASTLKLLKKLKVDLHDLSGKILAGVHTETQDVEARQILPDLNKIDVLLRSNQHLYKGYQNLIDRILQFNDNGKVGPYIGVSKVTCYRFERLGDHIKYLVLNYLEEAIDESKGLSTTYFNITAQKESQATARLSSSAATLSKLGVLFLPVSLMTGYFSVQIQELEGVYTAKHYWVSFAVIMVLSFLALFLFSQMLNNVGTRSIGMVKRWLCLGDVE